MADKKADETKKPEEVISPEDLLETKKAALSSLWGDDAAKVIDPPKEKEAEKPKEEKLDEKPKEEKAADAPKDDGKPAAKVIAKKKGKAKDGEKAADDKSEPEPAPPVDVEETVNRVLDERSAGDGGESRRDQKSGADDTLDVEDREVLSVLQKMEEANPRNKGLAARTREFWKKEEAYQQKWEAEHPDDEFDPDAKEHAGFYKRNEPEFNQAEFNSTKESIREDRLVARARDEARKEYAEKLKPIEAKQREEEIAPIIQEAANKATLDLLASVPEFAAAMTDSAGDIVLAEDTSAKLSAINPAMFDIASEEADRLAATVKVLEKHVNMPDHFPADHGHRVTVNGQTIRPFVEISDTFHELERKVAAQPAAKSMLGQKRFITNGDLRARQDEIIANDKLSPAAKQREFEKLESSTWSITPEDVKDRLIAASKARLKVYSEKTKKWASSQKNGDPKSGETGGGGKDEKKAEKPTPPPSGSTASSSDIQDNGKKGGDKTDSQHKSVVEVMW